MKKILAILIIALSSLAIKPANALAASAIPVLEYHYIRNFTYPGDPEGHVLSVSIPDFDAQMHYLKTNGYTPVDLDTAAAIVHGQEAGPAKPVVLTFDDGTIDFYANAYPILKKYGFKATSFVITGFVGQSAWISWNNVHEMEGSGLISFEDHTVDHKALTYLSPSEVSFEVSASKSILQQETGKTVNFIAYPDGASDYTVWHTVQNAGYVGGFGEWYGLMTTTSMDMPRVRVNGGESLQTFVSKL